VLQGFLAFGACIELCFDRCACQTFALLTSVDLHLWYRSGSFARIADMLDINLFRAGTHKPVTLSRERSLLLTTL